MLKRKVNCYCASIILLCCLNESAYALKTDGDQIAHFTASHANINQETGISVFTENVTIDQGTSHLRATEAVTKTNKKNELICATAKGNATIQAHFWTLTEPTKPEMHAYADTITFYPQTHVIELQGDADKVIIDQGSTHLRASEAISKLNDKNQLISATAKGNATLQAHFWSLPDIKKPELHAHADTIIFYPDKHLIEMQGNAHVEQGSDSFSAAFIQYDTKEDHVISKSDGKTQTVIIFHPGKKYE